MTKKLVFIDNDDSHISIEEAETAKRNLINFGGLSEEIVNNMEVVSNFGKKSDDEIYALLFDKSNAICTWSMYTASHAGSLFQLLNLLKSVGNNRVKELIYFDTSGEIKKALDFHLMEQCKQHAVAILNAIETNYIISVDFSDLKARMYRLRVNLTGMNKSFYVKEYIDSDYIMNLLNQEVIPDKRFLKRERK